MKIKRLKFGLGDLLFYLPYGIFLITGILYRTFYSQYFSSIYSKIKYFCIAILILREFHINKYTIRSLLIGALFLTLIFITRSQSSLATITYILIFVFCARNVDFKGIVKFSAWASLLTVLFVIASAYLGIIDNYAHYGSNRIRYYLGFRYSLYGPTFLFNITCLFVYLKKDKVKWISLFALAAFNCWMFIMTRSRLSFGLSMLMIISAGFLKLFPNFLKRKRILCMLMVFSFVICGFISLCFTIIYDSSVAWQEQLNTVLEDRLSLGQSALQEYGITLFGQDIKFVGNGLDESGEQNTTDAYNYVDSYYEQTLLRYGIIFEIILIGMLTYTAYYFYKRKDYWLLIWFTAVAGHCIIEATIDLFYCSYWFALSVALLHTKTEDSDRKEVSRRDELWVESEL